jgi:hypothetical protein
MKAIPLYPKTKRALTPLEFIELSPEEREKIKVVRIIPPKLGKWGFGKILVEYRHPIYEVSLRYAR